MHWMKPYAASSRIIHRVGEQVIDVDEHRCGHGYPRRKKFFAKKNCGNHRGDDEMQAEISCAGREGHYVLRRVDVDSDRILKKRFGLRIPVLEFDGQVVFEGHLTAADFRSRLDQARRVRHARRCTGGAT